MNSPRNSSSNVSSSISNNNINNCIQIPTSPLTPRTITTPRSDSNPYPTTFVQADTSTFKHVVQMLTGSSETTTKTKPPQPPPQQQQHPQQQQDLLSLPLPLPPSRSFNIPPKKQGFKLYERRNNSLKNTLMINTLMPNYAQNIIISNNSGAFSPRKQPEILSPSLLDFPSLALSPVTPLNDDPLSPSLGNSSSEEDKAIAEKGFYLHPSPRTSSTPRDSKPPQLLPLFPVTSPRLSESSSS
ncbi:hypothetical protein RIF29_39097 [Crotalaria pallida]|uniref:VQ domain-containing protein n=1 Tax=Crotalaria pallida TaxID=3830 RepID=A0AAN9HSZ7_CROPI